jgi:serine/threonine-protein kinase HipA
MPERLLVYRDGKLLGRLEQDRELSFAYTDEILAGNADEILISASMRIRRRPFTERELLPFFEGLLPEGLARQRVATRFRLGYGDVFGLLREIGRDCAGALSILPEGQDPTASALEGVLWLDDAALIELVDRLDTVPLGIQPEKDVRLSLAGAQDKVVIVVNPETKAIGLPRGTTPSTHILKPAPKERYPGLVLNEAYCLVLAKEAGLSVSKMDLIDIGGTPALMLERYDRARTGEGVIRVHQEDFCQALRVPIDKKYQSDGGPDLRRMVELLYRISSDADTDVERLIQWEAFNCLVGNADGHAKNVAMLYAGEYRLAPAYDLICTEMFPDLPTELGQSIGGEYQARSITAEHWTREFDRLQLNRPLFARRLAVLAERIEAALPIADAWLQDRGYWSDSLQIVGRLVRERSLALSGWNPPN